MPQIFEDLMRCYTINVDFVAEDISEVVNDLTTGKNKNFTSLPVDLKLFGGKKLLSLNTSALE